MLFTKCIQENIMPNYNFKCTSCDIKITIRKKISEISSHVEKCNNCGNNMVQFINSFSSSVKLDAEQQRDKIKEDARKIADKVRSGDQSLISQIYGDK